MTNPHAPSRRLRAVCFSPYPIQGPSVYHRIWAYRDDWIAHGIDLTLWPFMSDRFYVRRRRFGWFATLEKLIRFIGATIKLLVRLPSVLRYDVVIIHRELFPIGPLILERILFWLNPNVIFDVDDAIWHPPSNPVHQRRLFWSKQRVPKLLAASRAVVAGSAYLAQFARRYNDRVTIIPTPYDDLGERGNSTDPRKPVVVWIGNLGNAEYLLTILPVLEKLAQSCGFTLRLIGGDDVRHIRSAVVDIDYCRWRRDLEAKWLKESDIGIMPLADGEYERGKCAFKLVQYFSASLPVIASPVGMNCQVIRDGVNGFLASDDDQWYQTLRTLLNDPAQRREVGQRGHQTFLERFTRSANAERWRRVFLAQCEPPESSGRAGAAPANPDHSGL